MPSSDRRQRRDKIGMVPYYVELPRSLKARLNVQAVSEGLYASEIVVRAIERELDDPQPNGRPGRRPPLRRS